MMKMNKGDLVMFRKPNLNLYKYADRDTEELYILKSDFKIQFWILAEIECRCMIFLIF